MDAHVVWLTGLSGAGKSTLARALTQRIEAMGPSGGPEVEWIDGDELRAVFPATGFTREAREEHVRRVGYMAGRLEAHGVFVIVSLISPYRDSRKSARAFCRSFVEVHVATPLDVCESRDIKGLYRRARSGELRNFTGLSSPYEEPENPELRVDFSDLPTEAAVEKIVKVLETR